MYSIKALTGKTHQTCIKEEVNGYEISIAFDDSCGGLAECSRGDIRVFNKSRTFFSHDFTILVSKYIFGEDCVIEGSIENLIKVYEWCKSN